MASGKKNYFRHSFSARNNVKIQSLIDKFGLAGYFYWFALVELCAELSVDGTKIEYVYHERTLIKELRLNKNRLNLALTYMQSISLLSLTYNENTYALCIPNLSKYMGYYETKFQSNSPKESKVNEIKRNKKKEENPSSFFSSPPSLNERDAIPDEFKKEFGKKLLETNWANNHDYFYANNVKKDYFQFQRESLERTRDKFGDELQDQKEISSYFKNLQRKLNEPRRDTESQEG
jgi:hypothetical protein